MTRLIATVFGSGYLRPAPGTWGSIVSVGLAWLCVTFLGTLIFTLLIPFLFLIGWHATHKMTKNSQDHDPSEIVIDELVGQWIALTPVIFGAYFTSNAPFDLWPGWISGFVLFRFFDITKPSIIGHADRRGDALGVMLDDVYAGVFAALFTVLLAAIVHMVLVL